MRPRVPCVTGSATVKVLNVHMVVAACLALMVSACTRECLETWLAFLQYFLRGNNVAPSYSTSNSLGRHKNNNATDGNFAVHHVHGRCPEACHLVRQRPTTEGAAKPPLSVHKSASLHGSASGTASWLLMRSHDAATRMTARGSTAKAALNLTHYLYRRRRWCRAANALWERECQASRRMRVCQQRQRIPRDQRVETVRLFQGYLRLGSDESSKRWWHQMFCTVLAHRLTRTTRKDSHIYLVDAVGDAHDLRQIVSRHDSEVLSEVWGWQQQWRVANDVMVEVGGVVTAEAYYVIARATKFKPGYLNSTVRSLLLCAQATLVSGRRMHWFVVQNWTDTRGTLVVFCVWPVRKSIHTIPVNIPQTESLTWWKPRRTCVPGQQAPTAACWMVKPPVKLRRCRSGDGGVNSRMAHLLCPT